MLRYHILKCLLIKCYKFILSYILLTFFYYETFAYVYWTFLVSLQSMPVFCLFSLSIIYMVCLMEDSFRCLGNRFFIFIDPQFLVLHEWKWILPEQSNNNYDAFLIINLNSAFQSRISRSCLIEIFFLNITELGLRLSLSYLSRNSNSRFQKLWLVQQTSW